MPSFWSAVEKRNSKASGLQGQGGSQVRVPSLLTAHLVIFRARGAPSSSSGPFSGFVQQCLGRHHPVDQTDAPGLFGLDRVAEVKQFLGPAQSHQPRQALRPAGPGDQTEFDLGLSETSSFRGDAEIAAQGQFAASAQGQA